MKRILLAGVASLAFLGVAAAADLPAKAPVFKAPPAPTFDWTGFYLGGYYGSPIGQSQVTSTGTGGSAELASDRFTAGVDLGYNWQFNPNWLVGVEGDVGYLGTKRSFQDANDSTTFPGLKSTWYSTLRGRLGYVTGPSLLYVTGGGAWVRLEETFGGNGAVAATTNKTTNGGWTAGAGIETKLSRSWTAKTEYLYVDVGSNSFAATTVQGAPDSVTFKNQFHVIKTGLNYKFGEPFELPFMLAPISGPQRWAGFYAGVNAGGGLSLVRTPNQTFAALPGGGETDVNGGGFAGGGQIGYNLVAFSNWIVGVEGDIGYLGINNSHVDWNNDGVAQTVYQPGVKTNWYSTVRGRVGTSTGPALLYASGGFAAVNLENSAVVGTTGYSSQGTRTGWSFGGGIEIELTSQWSAKLEDIYINTGTNTLTTPVGSVDFKNNFHLVRAGLNYKFGGDELVRARY
jgi:outer membrane immunogenic protein